MLQLSATSTNRHNLSAGRKGPATGNTVTHLTTCCAAGESAAYGQELTAETVIAILDLKKITLN